MILTGGRYSLDKVTEYSESGLTRNLPELQQGRQSHGCSYFENEEGTKVDIDKEFLWRHYLSDIPRHGRLR